MKAQEFSYWLQGYFELSGENAPFDRTKAQKILNKMDKVSIKDAPPQIAEMIGFVKASLEYVLQTADVRMIAQISVSIQDKLNATFVHAIDPSYQGDQNQFNQAHHGRKDKEDFGLGTPRC